MLDRVGTYRRLAAALPDIPRWLETRSMLLSGEGEVIGLEEGAAFDYVVRDPYNTLICLAGRPPAAAVQEAVFRNEGRGVVICQVDDEGYATPLLPGWRPSPAVLHELGDESRLPAVPRGAVRVISFADITGAEGIPEPLRHELQSALLRSEVAARFVGGRPVSFCYAASVTETLWDISIDTLEEYRGQGHAALAVAFMVRRLGRRGKRPVWGAEEPNAPSLALARRLGFRPVDRLIVFAAPA